ncbi:MAG: FAD-dependent oxidoreductase [Rhizobium giardinii]
MVSVTLRRNFRQIDPATSTITLIEGGDRILPSFAPSLSRKAAGHLAKLGVTVMTGVKVDRVDVQGVIAGGEQIPKRDRAVDGRRGRIANHPGAGSKTHRAGRVMVEPLLNLPDEPNISWWAMRRPSNRRHDTKIANLSDF